MKNDAHGRLAFWSLFVAYAVYLIGLSLIQPLVDSHSLVLDLFYSLAAAAIAVGCWIALGDGSWVIRFLVGAWSLICVWIMWMLAVRIYAINQPGQPGSTTEGFTIYAAGNAVIALFVTTLLIGPARLLTGLRLVRDAQLGPLIPTRRSFTLTEFLCGVAIIATTLGAARLVAPRDWTYFAWFARPKAVLGFHWHWTCATLVAVPTALLLVYPRRVFLAAFYFSAAVAAVILQQRWNVLGKVSLSGWGVYWVREALRVAPVVIHASALMGLFKYLGYSLTWNLRSRVTAPR